MFALDIREHGHKQGLRLASHMSPGEQRFARPADGRCSTATRSLGLAGARHQHRGPTAWALWRSIRHETISASRLRVGVTNVVRRPALTDATDASCAQTLGRDSNTNTNHR